jgi:hypothetical protein
MLENLSGVAAVLRLAQGTELGQTYTVSPATPLELPLLVSGNDWRSNAEKSQERGKESNRSSQPHSA